MSSVMESLGSKMVWPWLMVLIGLIYAYVLKGENSTESAFHPKHHDSKIVAHEVLFIQT